MSLCQRESPFTHKTQTFEEKINTYKFQKSFQCSSSSECSSSHKRSKSRDCNLEKASSSSCTSKLQRKTTPISSQLIQKQKNMKWKDKYSNGFQVEWRDKFSSMCEECFSKKHQKYCSHFKEERLRLLLVGHNPSISAYESGFYYRANSNRMWDLLRGTMPQRSWKGILPKSMSCQDQNLMPHLLGVGFTDVLLLPGNDASCFQQSAFLQWKPNFYQRLEQHLKRVQDNFHKVENGKDKNQSNTRICSCSHQHSPYIVAFTGKRHFAYLFTPPLKKITVGKQSILPPDWPLPDSTEVWILPSSSGRAAMTHEQRSLPYVELANRFHTLPNSPSWNRMDLLQEFR